MKPRVLIFSTAYAPLTGGAEVAIREITDRLTDYDFDLITARFDKSFAPEEVVGNVRVHRLGFGAITDKYLVPLLGIFKILKLEKERKVDLFWAVQATYTSGSAYMLNIFRFWKKVPILLTLQEGELDGIEGKEKYGISGIIWRLFMLPLVLVSPSVWKRDGSLINLSWRLALQRTNFLTAISTYLEHRARSFGYKGPSQIIPNGVSLEQFGKSYKKNERLATRKTLGLAPDDVVLVTTSRLVPKNGLADVIKALAYLPKEVKFLCLGTGPLEDELKALAKEYQVSDRVVWKGNVPNRELSPILGASDIFIRPSITEGLGISFLEAMAAGLPVIATPVGGIPDFLKDGVTGLNCEVRNSVSIAECVKRLMANPSLRKELTKNASAMIAERFVWDKIVENMRTVFADLIVN